MNRSLGTTTPRPESEDVATSTKETYSLKLTTEAVVSRNETLVKSLRCRSSDDCGPDTYCELRSGVCRCAPGFEGEPPSIPCTGNYLFFYLNISITYWFKLY
ncbi:unnamed protein product [Gongylonema pulchrum]|uniref:EGF-like domain-containing protein n=1 Tax=Gongylonema pulchrum TaxID=637853 RepID=A0A183DHK7_9BILA|nr:unnamed protein product [Gongylonema pulchrum]